MTKFSRNERFPTYLCVWIQRFLWRLLELFFNFNLFPQTFLYIYPYPDIMQISVPFSSLHSSLSRDGQILFPLDFIHDVVHGPFQLSLLLFSYHSDFILNFLSFFLPFSFLVYFHLSSFFLSSFYFSSRFPLFISLLIF